MFTGIIEEVGRIRSVQSSASSARITVEARTLLEDIHLGDSIAVTGTCLTVVSFDGSSFTLDVSPETLKTTTLGGLNSGDPVNLERAMQAGGRFGGHMVSGHVDGVGELSGKKMDGNAWVMTFSAPAEILSLSVPKGSIAIDGISLTINEVGDQTFSVSIIPHTLKMTTLGNKEIGSPVNLEGDLIGKYVYRILSRQDGPKGPRSREINMGFLSEHGFI